MGSRAWEQALWKDSGLPSFLLLLGVLVTCGGAPKQMLPQPPSLPVPRGVEPSPAPFPSRCSSFSWAPPQPVPSVW